MKITVNLMAITKPSDEQLEDIKRPIAEWGMSDDSPEVCEIRENYSEFMGYDSLKSITVTTEWSRIPYSQLYSLAKKLGINWRNIIFENRTVLTFPLMDDNLKDIVKEWEYKWRQGRNSFSVEFDDCQITIHPTKNFSFYQLKDLVERLPDSIIPEVQ